MKIYRSVTIDIESGKILHENSYDYYGPVALCIDAVSSRTLMDTENLVIMQFTNLSDGTGESDVKKVDVSELSPACAEVIINRAIFNCEGMGVNIEWDASTDVVALVCGGSGDIDYREICGGLTNNAAAGLTGDVFFTTAGHSAGDTYNIILIMEKVGV